MKRTLIAKLRDRVSFYEWAYGRLAEADSDLGPIAEYIIGSNLKCLPESRRVNAIYDLVLPDGRGIEVKATGKKKTQSEGRPPIYRWGVGTQINSGAKLADLWFFMKAEFPATAAESTRFDVFDTKYWTIYMATGEQMAEACVSSYVTEKVLDRIGAKQITISDLKKL